VEDFDRMQGRAADDVIIAAPGTSCRHQIKDGTGRTALHPVEVLHAALREGVSSGRGENLVPLPRVSSRERPKTM
jgi:hypothetical protein